MSMNKISFKEMVKILLKDAKTPVEVIHQLKANGWTVEEYIIERDARSVVTAKMLVESESNKRFAARLKNWAKSGSWEKFSHAIL